MADMNGAGRPPREVMNGVMNEIFFCASQWRSPIALPTPGHTEGAMHRICAPLRGLAGRCRAERQKVEQPTVSRFPVTLQRVSGALSRPLTALHHRELKLSCFASPSFTASCSKETAPRPHGTLAPCSKSRRRRAPSPSASFLGQEKQKPAETAEL